MSDLKPLYWLRDAKLTDRYMAVGSPWELVPALSFLGGLRERVEHIGLNAQRLWPRKRLCRAADITQAWEKFKKVMPVRDAFLLDTRWYKQTIFIGPVTDEFGEKHFVKYFKNRDDAGLAHHQSEFMEVHFGQSFKIVSAKILDDVIVVYPLIDHAKNNIPLNDLMVLTVDVGAGLFDINRDNTKSITSFTTLDMPVMFKKDGAQDLWRLVRAMIEDNAQDIAITPIHGDMVPWNSFYDLSGNIALVDYERCGWHVPFYDAFHLAVQPPTMKGKVHYPREVFSGVISATGVSQKTVLTWFALYLLDQLRFDMDSYYNQTQQYARLKRGIDIKLTLLQKAIQDLNAHD